VLDGLFDFFHRCSGFYQDRVDLLGFDAVDHWAVVDACENDDGEVLQAKVGSQGFEQAASVELGHAEVEDDQVGRVADHLIERASAVIHAFDGVAEFAEIFADHFQQDWVVVDETNLSHTGTIGGGSKGDL
jgi:hypothetical protein